MLVVLFFFQAEDGIRDLVRSRGLGDVYKRQVASPSTRRLPISCSPNQKRGLDSGRWNSGSWFRICLLYTSDAADERSSVDLGGRRIIKKKNKSEVAGVCVVTENKK